jgi:hypothetical protein
VTTFVESIVFGSGISEAIFAPADPDDDCCCTTGVSRWGLHGGSGEAFLTAADPQSTVVANMAPVSALPLLAMLTSPSTPASTADAVEVASAGAKAGRRVVTIVAVADVAITAAAPTQSTNVIGVAHIG